ncbi:unnamed protein product [Arctogadus glacialis]
MRQTKASDVTEVRCLVLRGLPVILGDDPSSFFKACFCGYLIIILDRRAAAPTGLLLENRSEDSTQNHLSPSTQTGSAPHTGRYTTQEPEMERRHTTQEPEMERRHTTQEPEMEKSEESTTTCCHVHHHTSFVLRVASADSSPEFPQNS